MIGKKGITIFCTTASSFIVVLFLDLETIGVYSDITLNVISNDVENSFDLPIDHEIKNFRCYFEDQEESFDCDIFKPRVFEEKPITYIKNIENTSILAKPTKEELSKRDNLFQIKFKSKHWKTDYILHPKLFISVRHATSDNNSEYANLTIISAQYKELKNMYSPSKDKRWGIFNLLVVKALADADVNTDDKNVSCWFDKHSEVNEKNQDNCKMFYLIKDQITNDLLTTSDIPNFAEKVNNVKKDQNYLVCWFSTASLNNFDNDEKNILHYKNNETSTKASFLFQNFLFSFNDKNWVF